MEITKTPQDNIESFLYNKVNIEIYDLLIDSNRYTESETLSFFNRLYDKFYFFNNNCNNYKTIKNYFEEYFYYNMICDNYDDKNTPYIHIMLIKLIDFHYAEESNVIVLKSYECVKTIFDRKGDKHQFKKKYQFYFTLKYIKTLPTTSEKIKYLLEVKTDYLQDYGYENSYVLEYPFDKQCDLEIEKQKALLILEQTTSTTQQPTIELIDLSNTSAVEKIIYLNELGIIDFLRTKPEFMGSTNLMATFLSAITDEKATTVQTSISKLINNDTADKNHPYKAKGTVNKIKQTLIDKNIKLKTS